MSDVSPTLPTDEDWPQPAPSDPSARFDPPEHVGEVSLSVPDTRMAGADSLSIEGAAAADGGDTERGITTAMAEFDKAEATPEHAPGWAGDLEYPVTDGAPAPDA